MPYTILIREGATADGVLGTLLQLLSTSRFSAKLTAVNAHEIVVKPVRLKESKPYCGQHPDECAVGGPRRSSKCLEWDDWVEFNGLVNDALDGLGCSADVWSYPPEKLDTGKQMWVRRRKERRQRYDWTERRGTGSFVRPVRVWNHGTPDQFLSTAVG